MTMAVMFKLLLHDINVITFIVGTAAMFKAFTANPQRTILDEAQRTRGFVDEDEKITLNVGGMKHETYKHVLLKVPQTRLSRLTESLTNYDALKNEYFFDRHPGVFAQILNYYRTGKLHYPTNLCSEAFEEELRYWGIEPTQVEPCCWMTYTNHRDNEATIAVINSLDPAESHRRPTAVEVARKFGWEAAFQNGTMSTWQHWKPFIWSIVDEPWTSNAALIVEVVSILSILTSAMIIMLRTVTPFGDGTGCPSLKETKIYENVTEPMDPELAKACTSRELWLATTSWIQLACNLFFAVEIICRFVTCPNKLHFYKHPMNVIDFISTLPYFVGLLVAWLTHYDGAVEGTYSCLGIIRLYKLSQYSTDFRILLKTWYASAKQLILMLFFITVAMVLFATLAYYAERTQANPDNQVYSINKGMWWAIVTMCVGYGDVEMVTGCGKFIASTLIFVSTFIMALPVPIFVENFEKIYARHLIRKKLPKERRQVVAESITSIASLVAAPVRKVGVSGRATRKITPAQQPMAICRTPSDDCEISEV